MSPHFLSHKPWTATRIAIYHIYCLVHSMSQVPHAPNLMHTWSHLHLTVFWCESLKACANTKFKSSHACRKVGSIMWFLKLHIFVTVQWQSKSIWYIVLCVWDHSRQWQQHHMPLKTIYFDVYLQNTVQFKKLITIHKIALVKASEGTGY